MPHCYCVEVEVMIETSILIIITSFLFFLVYSPSLEHMFSRLLSQPTTSNYKSSEKVSCVFSLTTMDTTTLFNKQYYTLLTCSYIKKYILHLLKYKNMQTLKAFEVLNQTVLFLKMQLTELTKTVFC